MTRSMRCILVREWTQSAVKLGGPNVRIRYAWFGVPEGCGRNKIVVDLLQGELNENGYVWLRASLLHLRLGFPDPAPGRQKRLLVLFEGDNEYIDESVLWGFTSTLGRTMIVKTTLNGFLLSIYGTTAYTAAMVASGCPITGIAITCVLPIVGGLAAGYNSLGSMIEMIYESPGAECAICCEFLSDNDMDILKCGHAFHQDCVGQWIESRSEWWFPQDCPLCRRPLYEIGDNILPRITEDTEKSLEVSHAVRVAVDASGDSATNAHHLWDPVHAVSFLAQHDHTPTMLELGALLFT